MSDHSQNQSEAVLKRYFGEIRNYPLLQPEEEIYLARRIRHGDKVALNSLIKANLRFVVSIAMEYRNQGLPMEDLINEGNLGLIKAAYRFDETKGFKFISYAVWWIRQSIMQAISDHSRTVRIPVNRISTINRIVRALSALEQEFERPPTVDEVAVSLDTSAYEIRKILQYPGRYLSLDEPSVDRDKQHIAKVVSDRNDDMPDKPLADESLQSELERALGSLKKKEADILRLYYGLNAERALTLDEIGKRYRLTRERVRQIKEKALFRLRHQSRSKNLRQFLG